MWPSKKIIPIALASIVSLGAILFVVAYFSSDPTAPATTENGELKIGTSSSEYNDPNWKILLDNIATDTPQLISAGFGTSGPTTITEKFSQDLISGYIDLKNSNPNAGKREIVEMESLLLSNLKPKAMVPQFSLANIKTFPDSKSEAVRGYANSFAQILGEHWQAFAMNPFKLLNDIASTGDKTKLAPITVQAKIFKDLATELSKLYVPASLAGTHLQAINYYYWMGKTVEELLTAFEDPIKVVIVNRQYIESINVIDGVYGKLKNFFINQKIVFGDNEVGNIWYKF